MKITHSLDRPPLHAILYAQNLTLGEMEIAVSDFNFKYGSTLNLKSVCGIIIISLHALNGCESLYDENKRNLDIGKEILYIVIQEQLEKRNEKA